MLVSLLPGISSVLIAITLYFCTYNLPVAPKYPQNKVANKQHGPQSSCPLSSLTCQQLWLSFLVWADLLCALSVPSALLAVMYAVPQPGILFSTPYIYFSWLRQPHSGPGLTCFGSRSFLLFLLHIPSTLTFNELSPHPIMGWVHW